MKFFQSLTNAMKVTQTAVAAFVVVGALVILPLVAMAANPPAPTPQNLGFDPKDGTASLFTKAKTADITSIKVIDLNSADPLSVTLSLINAGLSLLAIGFLLLLIYAGVLWVTARGNSEQVTKAQTYLIRAAVGFGIILGSLGFSVLLFNVISTTTDPAPASTNPTTAPAAS